MQGEGDIVGGSRVKGTLWEEAGRRGYCGSVQGEGDIVGGCRVKGTL